MRVLRAAVAIQLLPFALAVMAGRASAQSVDAQELFTQGRKALAARDYSTACVKLEASERLERAVGTLLSLAECEEGLGQLASARVHLEEAASLADATHDRADRGQIARRRSEEIDKRVPRLTLRLVAGAPQDSRATRDGVDLGAAEFGTAIPVDPGKHLIVVSAAGRADATFAINLSEGEQKTIDVAPGEPALVVPPPSPPTQTAPPAASGHEKPVQVTPEVATGSSQRTWAYVAAGSGVVGVALGSVFGVQALSTWSQAKQDCGTGCPAGSSARTEQGHAQTEATVSTVAFAAGGIALAVGAYVFFTEAPASKPATGVRVAPWLGANCGGAAVRGAW
jgi:hypothetical protein